MLTRQCCKKKLWHGAKETESWWWGQKFVSRLKKLPTGEFYFHRVYQSNPYISLHILLCNDACCCIPLLQRCSLTGKTNQLICTFSQEAFAAPAILRSKKFFYQCHQRRRHKYTQKVRPGKKFVSDTDYVEQPFLTWGHGTPSVPWINFRGCLNLNWGKNYVNATNLKLKYSFSLAVNVDNKVIYGLYTPKEFVNFNKSQ